MLAVLAVSVLAQSTLPDIWIGDWRGTTSVVGTDGVERHKAPMRLRIAKLPEAGQWTWALTYGEGEKADRRPYVLEAGAQPNQFDLDEKNGIILPMGLVGKTMWSHFKVGESLLTGRYQLAGDQMEIEIATFSAADSKKAKAGGFDVEGYGFRSIQRATLKRVPTGSSPTK